MMVNIKFCQLYIEYEPFALKLSFLSLSSTSQSLVKLYIANRRYSDMKKVTLSTRSISSIVQKLVHERYESVHVVIFGYSGDRNYQIYEVLPRGTLVSQRLVCAGAGSGCILGLLEAQQTLEEEQQMKSESFDRSEKNPTEFDDSSDSNESEDSLAKRERLVKLAIRTAMSSDHRVGGKEKVLRFTKTHGLVLRK